MHVLGTKGRPRMPTKQHIDMKTDHRDDPNGSSMVNSNKILRADPDDSALLLSARILPW